MANCFAVDQFTQPPAVADFEAFQADIVKTADALGLGQPDQDGFLPLIVGSGAAAMQGLDMRVNKPGYISDLDVIVSSARFVELEDAGILRHPSRLHEGLYMGSTRRTSDRPLPVDMFTSEHPDGYNSVGFHGEEGYKGTPNSSTVEVGGLHVLRATAVAADKLRFDEVRVKDLGIIKAHVVAASTGHEIVDDEEWKSLVAKAMGKVMTNSVDLGLDPIWRRVLRRPDYPVWLTQLKRAKFEHPAFEDILR